MKNLFYTLGAYSNLASPEMNLAESDIVQLGQEYSNQNAKLVSQALLLSLPRLRFIYCEVSRSAKVPFVGSSAGKNNIAVCAVRIRY